MRAHDGLEKDVDRNGRSALANDVDYILGIDCIFRIADGLRDNVECEGGDRVGRDVGEPTDGGDPFSFGVFPSVSDRDDDDLEEEADEKRNAELESAL